jgi:predicted deacylase
VYDPAQIDFARPGKHHYQVAFGYDGTWGFALVPLTVINGLRPGKAGSAEPPGIYINGGNHGNEYEGQIVVKRLCRELDPAAMRGRVLLIPQLNQPACVAGMRESPLDGVNMNRAFPGNPRGTITSRIANFVKTRIFPQVRVVIDIHSGGPEDAFLLSTSFHPIPDAAQQAETALVAKLFDTPAVFIYSRSLHSGLLPDEAEDEGKVTVGGEFGGGPGSNPVGVKHAYEGCRNVFRHYGHLEGDPVRIDSARLAPPRVVAAPTLDYYVPCPCDGIWEPTAALGADVRSGDLLGRIHRFDDHTSEPVEIRTHRDGVLLMQYLGAVVQKGATLFVVGEEVDL